jgi:Right handed beta helix region
MLGDLIYIDMNLLLFCCVVMLAPLLHATTVTIGDPQQPANLPQAIVQAHAAGANDITIAPGTYDLPAGGHGAIVLSQWRDATIHADGVTLIFEDVSSRPVTLQDCARVTWDGGLLRFSRPAFTQGRIVQMGSDTAGKWCDWQIDDGYPTNNDAVTAYDIVDPQTRQLKTNTGDWTPQSSKPTGDRLFRLSYPLNQDPHFALHDWLVTRAPAGTTIVLLNHCDGCTVQNVTLQNAGFGAFYEGGGAGANHYFHCTIEPGPRPPGATEDQLVGCGADGLHSNDTHTGPDIEDFTCHGVFLDDCIAVHGLLHQVLQVDGPRVLVRMEQNGVAFDPPVGDPLRIANMNGFFGEAKIVSIQSSDHGTAWITLDQDLGVVIDPSGATDPHKGTQAADPNLCGAGYKILRCHLGDTRSRGILVKGDHGLIDGCTLDGCGMSAVSVGPEFWWGEAGYSWDVTVSGNTFLHCDRNNTDQATVYIHGDGAIGNRRIALKSNTFSGCYGTTIISTNWADGVEISGNRFDRSFGLRLDEPGNILFIAHSQNVTLLDNLVSQQDEFAGALVKLDDSVSPSNVHQIDSTGIRRVEADPASP